MLSIARSNVSRTICNPFLTGTNRCYSAPRTLRQFDIGNRNDVEYTKEPQYPAIEEISRHRSLYNKRKTKYSNLENLETVEEKLFALNLDKYYGFKALMLSDSQFPYNCQPLIQHCTRTVFHGDKPLPLAIGQQEQQLDSAQIESLLQSVKVDLEEAIAFEFTAYRPNINSLHDPELCRKEKARERNAKFVNHINRVLLNALTADYQHLTEAELDLDPRHEAFWFVGGIQPPINVRKLRKNDPSQKEFVDDSVNRAFQYVGKPFLTLRHKHPLQSFEIDATANLAEVVPKYEFDPRTNGFMTAQRHLATVPGYWPGSLQEFGLLSYHSRHHIPFRDSAFGAEDNQEAIHAQAILCSYGWLLGQACYQGFSTFNDLTYPLTTQTIITDGQWWSFYLYQLNTTGIHCDVYDTNRRANECWGTNEMKLFDEIDADGKVIGFNDDVLRHLIRFYTNKPIERNINMKPYLSKAAPFIGKLSDPERRQFLEKTYKHLVSNRPRSRLEPEIYNWEKIYKIDNKTKPLDPKRRFFELGESPWQRRLDDHYTGYVPKALRTNRREKCEKTYYPKI